MKVEEKARLMLSLAEDLGGKRLAHDIVDIMFQGPAAPPRRQPKAETALRKLWSQDGQEQLWVLRLAAWTDPKNPEDAEPGEWQGP